MYKIPAVIFAGGKSSRMGRDKALLPFDAFSTLSAFQHHKLSQLFSQVYISAKDNKFDFDCEVIEDKYKDCSPLVGLVSIFESLKVKEVFVLSVDAPLVDDSIINKLFLEKNRDADAIIAQTPNGIQPLCGIYRRSILPLAQGCLSQNNHRLTALLKASHLQLVSFGSNTLFANLNTPQEYQKILENFNS